MPRSAVILLSGGQDSTTCLFWARQYFDVLHAVSFRYGQRHEIELEAAGKIAEIAGVASWKILDCHALAQLAGSSLVGPGEIRANGGLADSEAPDGLPTSFVPGRNLLFLGLAASYAVQVGARHLVIGVSQADYSGYPDCREPFIEAMEEAVNHAMPSSVGRLVIETPLMRSDKAATVTLARELGDDCWKALGLSVTCYEGQRPGCGKCPACSLREAGFHAAGLEDPAHRNPQRHPAQVGDWVWSSDGKSYGEGFRSRQEADADALRELGGEAFYMAQVKECVDGVKTIKATIHADTIHDAAADYLYDHYGLEDADSRWHPASECLWAELTTRLHKTVDEWCVEKDLRVDHFVVEHVETVVPNQLPLKGIS
jgi:7-cyano-7-deazaguanine synthase